MKRPLVSTLVSLLLLAPLSHLTAQRTAPDPFMARPVAAQRGPVSATDTVLPYAADRLLIQFTPGAAATASGFTDSRVSGRMETGVAGLDALNRDVGVLRVRRSHPAPGNAPLAAAVGLDRWFTLDVPPGDMEQLAARYRNHPDVADAVPDYRAFPAVVPNDPLYSLQWGHNNTAQMLDYCWGCGGHPAGSPVGTPGFDANAQAAWDAPTGYGSAGVVVAILDTGVDAGHPDLNQTTGYDFGDNDSDPDDDSGAAGHGTACSGVAAAIAGNGIGVAGIAGGCTIMPLKVANSAGSLFFSSIQNALVYAADNGADVASMSFSADISNDPATSTALQYAYDAGVTLLAASSNSNQSHVHYPANHATVIAVGAASPCGDRKRSSSSPAELNPGVSPDPNGYTCDGERWWGSNYGVATQGAAGAIDVIAPTILPTTDIQGSGGYDPGSYSLWFNGTSCATPYAAGVCALILSANPGFTPAQVRDRLRTTAQDVVNVESGAGWDRYSGYGMVDAAAAVGGGVVVPPVAEFSGSPVSGDAPLTVQFTDLSANNPTSWSWDFGDGDNAATQNPSHEYVAAGVYTVSLTATNSAGSDGETKVGYITVAEPPSVIRRYATSDVPVAGTVSGSYANTLASDNVRETVTERESGGKPANRTSYAEHRWTFTVAAGVAVSFTVEASRTANGEGDDFAFEYSTNGTTWTSILTVASAVEQTYSAALPSGLSGGVTVRVVDTDQTPGNRSLDSVSIDAMYIETATVPATDPPVADFTGTPTGGSAPLAVDFTDQSTNNPTSWSWDFGDGNGSSQANPSHVYGSAGTYTVSLTATNSVGSDVETKVDYITVTQPQGTVMHVENITVGRTASGPWTRGTASVLVHDQNGQPVANAVVTGFFNVDSASLNAVTDGSGTASFTSEKTKTPPANICFEVTGVALGGATYDSGANVWTGRCEDGSGFSGIGLGDRGVAVSGVAVPSRAAPNPFLGATSISFALAESGPVRLEIFDVAGRRVDVLADGVLAAGAHELRWDASAVRAGIYFYRLATPDRVETQKLIRIR